MIVLLILLIVVAVAVKPRRRRSRAHPRITCQGKSESRPTDPDRSALIELYAIEAIEYQRKARATTDPLKKAYFNRRAGELYCKCEKLDNKPQG